MLEGLLQYTAPLKNMVDNFEHCHPNISLLIFQAAVGILLIAAVSGIALLGGGVIWAFYQAIGVM